MENLFIYSVLLITLIGPPFVLSQTEIECHECYYFKGIAGNEDCSKNPGETGTTKSTPCSIVARNGTTTPSRKSGTQALLPKCMTVEAKAQLDSTKYEVVARGPVCVEESLQSCTNVLPPNWQDLLPGDIPIPIGIDISASICYCDSDKCNDGHKLQFSTTFLALSLPLVYSSMS